MWSSKADAPDIPERLASEMKQRAYLERNEAHERMRAHKQSCSVCKSRLRVMPKQCREAAKSTGVLVLG
jgi:hypothetical protein